jgi:hypothetical protein
MRLGEKLCFASDPVVDFHRAVIQVGKLSDQSTQVVVDIGCLSRHVIMLRALLRETRRQFSNVMPSASVNDCQRT